MRLRPLVVGAAAGLIAAVAWLPATATNSPEPTGSPTPSPTPTPSPSPTPTPTPCPEPTPTSTSNDADEPEETSALGSVLEAVGSAVGDAVDAVTPDADGSETGADPCDASASPTPQPTTTGEPTGTPTSSPGTGGEKPPAEDADGDGANDEDESADGQDEPEMPEDATPTEQRFIETPADTPVVSPNPGQLTGSRITMYGLSYDGVVELPTPEGTIEVMQFTMDRSTTDDFELEVMGDDGSSSVTRTDELTIEGDVTFYTSRFEGTLLGFRWTFLPETPPPFTLPIMTFGDPEIELVAVEADILETEPVMRQTIGN